jgi:hypothetical protein
VQHFLGRGQGKAMVISIDKATALAYDRCGSTGRVNVRVEQELAKLDLWGEVRPGPHPGTPCAWM